MHGTTMGPMADGVPHSPLQQVLSRDLARSLYLTPEEVAGGWRQLLPDLAGCLPEPYPIFSRHEEKVVTHGYPVVASEGLRRLRGELERLVEMEVESRLTQDDDDRRRLVKQRDRYLSILTGIVENTVMSDSGRGLTEVFLLHHSAEAARILSRVPRLARLRGADSVATEDLRQATGISVCQLIQRSAVASVERLRRLTQMPLATRISPLFSVLCQDQLLLTETSPPRDLGQLSGYLRTRFHQDAGAVEGAARRALNRLRDHLLRQPEILDLLAMAVGSRLNLDRESTILEPRLLEALAVAGLLDPVGLSPLVMRVLTEMGTRLKCLELIATLRRRVLPVAWSGTRLLLASPPSTTPIAPSTRPFDFASPGVVDSAVRRFGLVYDLTNFTALLEEVRREGRHAEENALRFMYVFQGKLEEICRRRRLNFEKFLGDGAFYSSRRAHRVIAAACEIQLLYDQLRNSGFPFDRGLRIAMNFGTYRLLPMLHAGPNRRHFEFFGQGVVELVRLTTGKSLREIEEIAEFLIHSGYEPAKVDQFLQPLMTARGGRDTGVQRVYGATIDSRGELVNEGMVLTVPFLEELERELDLEILALVPRDGLRWVVFPLDPGQPDTLHVGLRHLGTARLKGLSPLDLVEAATWDSVPTGVRSVPVDPSLIEVLRRLSHDNGDEDPEDTTVEPSADSISADLAVVSFEPSRGARRWILGEYRAADDILLHAIHLPLEGPQGSTDEPLELWVFHKRNLLRQMYDDCRRDSNGASTPLSGLRQRPGFMACFLAAPHRSPG